MHLMNYGYFDYRKNVNTTQFEPHAGMKMVQVLGSLLYICGGNTTHHNLSALDMN